MSHFSLISVSSFLRTPAEYFQPPPPFNLQRGSDVTRMCCSFLFLWYNGFAEIYILRRIVRIVELATKWLFSVKSRLLDKLYICLFVCTWHFVTRYLRKAWSWNLKVFHAILKFIELNKLPFFMKSGYSLVFYCVSCISYHSSQLANRVKYQALSSVTCFDTNADWETAASC